VDASAAGKLARCKHCGHRFTIPDPGAAESEVYSLEASVEPPAEAADPAWSQPQTSAFVPAPRDQPASTVPRKRKRSVSRSSIRTVRSAVSQFAWRTWLGGVAAAAIVIAAIAVLAPGGVLIAACVVMAVGGLMILVGYSVGAYGAFREDSLYGVLYLAIPLYTAYYMVTRWDDLWFWFACMTGGVGLILLGIEMARWGGVVG
jgi:hypothetical protein